MKKQRGFWYRSCALAVGIGTLSITPMSQADEAWPTEAIRLVVGGPPGGSADFLARLLAEGLHPQVNKPVVVENKPGAAGVLAVNDLLTNGKNGHTFLIIQGGIVSETPLAYKVSFDPFKDLKPLAQISRTALVLVANKDLPVSDLQQLVQYGKAQKNGLTFASYATGMKGHTSGALLGQLTDMEMLHVGYRGSPPALTDLMGGHVSLMFDGLPSSLPLIKAERIKAIALNYPTRIAALPNVPTFKELGYPQLAQAGWFAVWSSSDTPPAIQQKIRDLTLAYFKQDAVRQRVMDTGMEAGGDATPEELEADLKEAYRQQAELLNSIDYQPE